MDNFERINRMSAGAPHNDWISILPDATEVVVSETGGQPNPLEVQKAISIVQGRSHLGKTSRRSFEKKVRGDLTVDFCAETRRYGSEFLMCFAFVAIHATLNKSSPYLEVGFSLPASSSTEDAPIFNATVKAFVGLPFP